MGGRGASYGKSKIGGGNKSESPLERTRRMYADFNKVLAEAKRGNYAAVEFEVSGWGTIKRYNHGGVWTDRVPGVLAKKYHKGKGTLKKKWKG